MKFAKIIGVCDPKIVREAEEKLSSCFTELALGFDNKSLGTGLGGDPLVHFLLYPLPHYCDALSIQLDDMNAKEKDQEQRIAKGEIIPDEEKIPDESKAYRRQMKGKVLRTAATNGKAYWWSPSFVNKCSRIGLRIVMMHESLHSLFMHPQRRGSRMPQLYNISVDYRVNFSIMEDLKARDVKDYEKVFAKELGEYITLEEYAAFLRDPFNPPPRLAHLNPTEGLRKMADPAYKDPYSDVRPMYYADHQLSDDMKRPENVYDYLLAQIPKCPVCGKLGKYKKPQEYKDLQKKIEEQEKKKAEEKAAKDKAEGKDTPTDNSGCCKDHKHSEEGDDCCEHDHSKDKQKGKSKKGDKNSQSGNEQSDQPGDQSSEQGQPGDGNGQSEGEPQPGEGSCCGGDEKDCGCPACGGKGGSGSDSDYEYVDPFGAGETLDDHIDSDVSEEELAKRLTDAIEMAKKMGAGKMPGGLEDELGLLSAPTLSVWDFIRMKMQKIRQGVGRSNWLKPRTRPMFAGLYVPTKKTYHVNFLAAYDCSGSMSQEDIAFGISQLQVLDEKGEGYLLPWDSGSPYYEDMVKVKAANIDELKKAKVKGRGGTNCSEVFNTYEEHCGKVDIIIIITDGFLYDNELANAKQPDKGTETIFIITSNNTNFKPPWGRVFHLRGEKL